MPRNTDLEALMTYERSIMRAAFALAGYWSVAHAQHIGRLIREQHPLMAAALDDLDSSTEATVTFYTRGENLVADDGDGWSLRR